MKSFILICVLLLSACGGGDSAATASISTPEPQTPASSPSVPEASLYEEKTITQTIDGALVERTYRLRYPENLTENQYPVVFFFHGAGGDGKDWLDNNPILADLIDAGEFIGVFPDGYQNNWNVSGETHANDVEFVGLILNSTDPSGFLDLTRTYAIGISSGAGLVNKVAKETSFFHAIAPLLSQQTQSVAETVSPQALSVFQVNGSEDTLVSANGGNGGNGFADSIFISAQASAENWAANASCNMTPANQIINWGDFTVEEYAFSDCTGNTRVRYFSVVDSGHSLSFGEDFTLYQLIWSFFKASESPQNIKLLALGDSYTIGQSVCESCSFPMQLKAALEMEYAEQDHIELQIIAETGWSTTNLKNAIATLTPAEDFDLATLLIGVNNQYRNNPFSLYETEFVELVNSAINFVGGDASKLIILSIPNYAFTQLGQSIGPDTISAEIELYNNFAKNYAEENEITYVYITDITEQGLEKPALLGSDNFHPSELAYSEFVERIMPLALEKLK
ncbi:GDSL-type esterase/lipase family protein [SAR92 clade bacterium H455]|uniref:GDSL-type esterase/lipase family protein n=1 Tax=SAR92 clade bacterium H455 TaxID=2974818 RepID=A0ABY5TR44_9GAMM|nr:GDSL-type esterase/lipase family protein [SAR92 clade bacterium H455]